MSNALRRLRKLENQFLDDSGFVPHSPEWYAYWLEKLQRRFNGDETVRVPLEALLMWMRQCDDSAEREEFLRSGT